MAALLSPVPTSSVRSSPPSPHLQQVWGAYNNESSFLRAREFPLLQLLPLEISFGMSRNGSGTPKLRSLKVFTAKGKGFGELVKKSKGEGERAASNVCPCGGGEERKDYGGCCGRFHGGVIEPDALIVMKARFSAYTRGVVPYIVKTTHPDNPDFVGAEKLAEDVRATCERLRFIKLDILDYEVSSESEAFVSFVAYYNFLKGGRKGDTKQLKEKSRFVKEDGRWLYCETVSLSQASEAAWMMATTPNFEGAEFSGKSFAKAKAQPTKIAPQGF